MASRQYVSYGALKGINLKLSVKSINIFPVNKLRYMVYCRSGTFNGHQVWRFGNKDRKTISFVDWPGIVIRYSHSVLLKIVLAVTLAWRFKKNYQTAKLKSRSNVPLIRYDKHMYITTQHTGRPVRPKIMSSNCS